MRGQVEIVRPVRLAILIMALKKDHSPNFIEAVNGGKVDVGYNGVEQEGKEDHTLESSVDIVVWRNTVKIIDIWAQAMQE